MRLYLVGRHIAMLVGVGHLVAQHAYHSSHDLVGKVLLASGFVERGVDVLELAFLRYSLVTERRHDIGEHAHDLARLAVLTRHGSLTIRLAATRRDLIPISRPIEPRHRDQRRDERRDYHGSRRCIIYYCAARVTAMRNRRAARCKPERACLSSRAWLT